LEGDKEFDELGCYLLKKVAGSKLLYTNLMKFKLQQGEILSEVLLIKVA